MTTAIALSSPADSPIKALAIQAYARLSERTQREYARAIRSYWQFSGGQLDRETVQAYAAREKARGIAAVSVNQPGLLEKRVRARRKPKGNQGKNSTRSYPAHGATLANGFDRSTETFVAISLWLSEPREPQRSEQAADRRADEIRLRADAPQPRAEERAGCHDAIPNQIVCAVCAGPNLRRSFEK